MILTSEISKYSPKMKIDTAYETTDVNLLVILSNDDNYCVRSAVARNPKVSEEILAKLADDESCLVRASVAKNNNTSKETLKKLSDDEAYTVRKGVAYNENTPEECLAKLAKDTSIGVRHAVSFAAPHLCSSKDVSNYINDCIKRLCHKSI